MFHDFSIPGFTFCMAEGTGQRPRGRCSQPFLPRKVSALTTSLKNSIHVTSREIQVLLMRQNPYIDIDMERTHLKYIVAFFVIVCLKANSADGMCGQKHDTGHWTEPKETMSLANSQSRCCSRNGTSPSVTTTFRTTRRKGSKRPRSTSAARGSMGHWCTWEPRSGPRPKAPPPETRPVNRSVWSQDPQTINHPSSPV